MAVQPAAMTDINKTIMRCLVKNLAMFGLGLRRVTPSIVTRVRHNIPNSDEK
jgi:hypothetical protein